MKTLISSIGRNCFTLSKSGLKKCNSNKLVLQNIDQNRSMISSSFSNLPSSVRIVEVGPRDGLQNEKNLVPSNIKIEFINKLSETGITAIECTSFVSPKWVPQMGDNKEVFTGINKKPGVDYLCLTPNVKGVEQAIEAGCKECCIFLAASDAFSLKNINCTVEESFKRSEETIALALKNNMKVRGYISCVGGCPYSGFVEPERVADIAYRLLKMGCYEISLGDTIGTLNPGLAVNLLHHVCRKIPTGQIAVHYHNTYGQALPNILTSIQFGVSTIDASVAGLGGCPYAKGASGNVPTEEVVYMLHGMGIETGVDLDKLVDAGDFISSYLGRENNSNVAKAILSKRGKSNNKKQQQMQQQKIFVNTTTTTNNSSSGNLGSEKDNRKLSACV
ncbi:hypothetical protein ABK040_006351 [Willaertia magna]